MTRPSWFTLTFTPGDFRTVFISPSKLAAGVILATVQAYVTDRTVIEWDTTGLLIGLIYLGGLIRYLDAAGTDDQH